MTRVLPSAREPATTQASHPTTPWLFSWLHVSDIHFGHPDVGHGWNQQLVLDALRADITARLDEPDTPRPDAILVTGDIAFSGAAAQYAQAREWLADLAGALGLGLADVFAVPGNHDVQRSADKQRDIGRLVRALRSGDEALDTALGDADDRAKLAARQSGYLAFAGDLGPGSDALYWSATPSGRRDLRVRLVGLNTALLCADNHDRGTLRLGQEQLARTLSQPASDELVIALSHHPLSGGWLADQRDAREWLRSRAHLHLAGHVHEAESEQARSGTGQHMVRLVAGAVHGDRLPAGFPASHGYNLAAITADDAGHLLVRIWPRRWSERSKTFKSDVDSVPDGQQSVEHKLGLQIATARAPRPEPRYPDPGTQSLSQALENAHKRKRKLAGAGRDTRQVTEEILDLKRRLRQGGQLKAGDTLGEDRYLLLGPIGRGGFAIVWEALDQTTGQCVAIKVLHSNLSGDPIRRDRFRRGARRMAELDHPAVVSVVEPEGEDVGYYYMVMELARGGTLHRAVLDKQMPEKDAIPLIIEVGAALAEAHQRGWVHRDVKPSNILLTESGKPRLTDFDLVKDDDTTGGTRTGAMGTFVYAAPEVMDKPQEAGAPADVFGLAMTAAFVLYGDKLPSRTVLRDPEGFIAQLDCPGGVKEVLKRAVAWEASERYEDASAFCEALAASVRAPVISTDEPARGTRRVERATGMTLLWLPGGTFTMGEGTSAHPVEVSSFWIGETVVTNQQYHKFVTATGREPEFWNDKLFNGSAQPVVGVSWSEAVAYCNYLSEQNNLTPCYRIKGNQVWWESWDGYRLPTEAEWEFACRAGTQTQYSFGDDAEELEEYAWFDKNSENTLQPVATRKPNLWGLYDMHGNVLEWCWDTFADYPDASSSEPRLDPAGPTGQRNDYTVDTDNLRKLLRGGSFAVRAEFLRSAVRSGSGPVFRSRVTGFRCVRGVPPALIP